MDGSGNVVFLSTSCTSLDTFTMRSVITGNSKIVSKKCPRWFDAKMDSCPTLFFFHTGFPPMPALLTSAYTFLPPR